MRSLIVAATMLVFAAQAFAHEELRQWVYVGDPGNPGDTSPALTIATTGWCDEGVTVTAQMEVTQGNPSTVRRLDAGNFVADGITAGEIVDVQGFTGGNNGLVDVAAVVTTSATNDTLQIVEGARNEGNLVNETGSGDESVMIFDSPWPGDGSFERAVSEVILALKASNPNDSFYMDDSSPNWRCGPGQQSGRTCGLTRAAQKVVAGGANQERWP